MEIKKIEADSRGQGSYGWLKTNYSFSFADYYNPDRLGFGKLRVINDDWIAPGAGFPAHSHHDMEIITIPFSGILAHEDNTGAKGTVPEGEVQVMSAGKWVEHSEYNASATEPLTLFQIWIETGKRGADARYDQKQYHPEDWQGKFLTLVGPEGEHPLWIYQRAYISRGAFEAGQAFTYEVQLPGNHVYLMVIEGECEVESQALSRRDALEITAPDRVSGRATDMRADILVIEVPGERT